MKREPGRDSSDGGGPHPVHKTFFGFVWSVLAIGVRAASQFISLVVLARFLTPEDFGIVGAALVITAFASFISQLGVAPAIIQRPTLEISHVKTGFITAVLGGLFFAVAVFELSDSIEQLFRIDGLAGIIKYFTIIFPVQGVGIVCEALLTRELRFPVLARIEMISFSIGYAMTGIVLAILGFGPMSLVGAWLAQVALKSVLLWIHRPHPIGLHFSIRSFIELMKFGAGYSIATFGNQLAGQGDKFIVGRWLGAEALGIFGRAYQLTVIPAVLFGQSINQVLFPTLSQHQDNPELLERSYRRGVTATAIAILPLCALLIALAPELIVVLLGNQWLEVIIPFQILAICILFRSSYMISDSIAQATGAVYARAWRQWLFALSILVCVWVGQRWGINGAAAGTLLAILINFFLMAQLSAKLISFRLADFAKAHLQGVALAVVVGGLCALLINFLRSADLAPLMIILLAMAFFLVALLALITQFPSQFLGVDGAWFIDRMAGKVPPSFLKLPYCASFMRKIKDISSG